MRLRISLLAVGVGLLCAACADTSGPERPSGPFAEDLPAERLAVTRSGAPVWRKVVYSPVFTIDRIYRSMTGPGSEDRIVLFQGETPEPELLWLVGYQVDIMAPDGGDTLSQEFMCHTNLEMDAVFYREHLPNPFRTSPRLFTLSQGQRSIDLPAGFGLPLLSDQPMSVDTQVLNHNIVGRTLDVRHRVTIDFVRDRDLTEPLEPLVLQSVFGYVVVEGPDGHFGLPPGATKDSLYGSGCLPGKDVGESQGSLGSILEDTAGRRVSSHWLVEPGRQENHSRVLRSMMELPYDTTAHYIAAHLHPFAESLELRDLTTGTTVYKTRVRGPRDGTIGIADVEYLSSPEGLPMYRDHAYELISIYENSSGVDQDSMAVLYLYVRAHDHDLEALRRPRTPPV